MERDEIILPDGRILPLRRRAECRDLRSVDGNGPRHLVSANRRDRRSASRRDDTRGDIWDVVA